MSRTDTIKAIVLRALDEHRQWLDGAEGLASLTLTVRVTKHGRAYECDFRPIAISRD